MNQAESDLLLTAFVNAGFTVVDFDEVADCYIVNSCAVTEEAERKTRQYIRRAIRKNPHGLVILTGCCAKFWTTLAHTFLGEQVVVLSEEDKERAICQLFEERFGISLPLPLFPNPPRARAWVKVQEGCNHFCSFCLVPRLRGGIRSRKLADILREVNHLVEQGIWEVVLCGTNLGYFGRDTKEGSLIDLVEFLVAHTRDVRFRLSSLEPYLLSEEFITRYFALGNRVCPHFHLPLQSASERILERMQRGYSPKRYADIVAMIRSLCPRAAVTTDIIVGFPGETPEDFETTVRFCEDMGFSRMHVFAFSPRPGTAAFDWEKKEGIPKLEKQRRVQRLLALGKILSERYHRSFVGEQLHVLVESVEEGIGFGYSENYIPVQIKDVQRRWVRTIIPVLVEKACSTHAEGRPLRE